MSTIASHSPLNISDSRKPLEIEVWFNQQQEMVNGNQMDDVT